MRESHTKGTSPSTFRGDRNATRKIPSPVERIHFRDLARLASRRKTEQFLHDKTGADERTAKRWLSGESRPPAAALAAVMADILGRLD